MNKRQIYENVMAVVAKNVKRAINENVLNEAGTRKKQFSKRDLAELKKYFLDDIDFYQCFCNKGDIENFESFEDSIDEFMYFLEYECDNDEWYIMDGPDSGTCWAKLASGKYANLDNLYAEFQILIS